jgi:hypothetical protein
MTEQCPSLLDILDFLSIPLLMEELEQLNDSDLQSQITLEIETPIAEITDTEMNSTSQEVEPASEVDSDSDRTVVEEFDLGIDSESDISLDKSTSEMRSEEMKLDEVNKRKLALNDDNFSEISDISSYYSEI